MRDESARSGRLWPPRSVARVGLAVLLLDQATKAIVLRAIEPQASIPVLDGFLNLVHVRNPGAAFSLFATAPEWFRGPFFLVVTLVAIGFLLRVSVRLGSDDRWLGAAFGAVLGGAAGNLVDRVRFGEVIDFIDVYWGAYHWPAFNVADSSISLGVVAIVLHSFGSRRRRADSSSEAGRGPRPGSEDRGVRATEAGGPSGSA